MSPTHYLGVESVLWHPSLKRKVVEYLAMGKVAWYLYIGKVMYSQYLGNVSVSKCGDKNWL